MAFKGVSVSFTGLSPQEKEAEGERIKQMGGTVSPDFSLGVDLLIAKNSEFTPKYRGALCWGKPVCHVRMIDALWKDGSRHVRDYVNQQHNDFKIPLFSDCVITVSGVDMNERDVIGKMITLNGGTYAPAMERGVCTHLLTDSTSGDKYKFAQIWGGIRIVMNRWLRKCLERDMRMPEEYYHPDPSIRRAVSPPRHNVDKNEVFPDTECRPIAPPLFSPPRPVCAKSSRVTLVQKTPTKLRVASVEIKKPASDDTIELGSSSDEDVLPGVYVKNENMTVNLGMGLEESEIAQEISRPEPSSFVLNQSFMVGSEETIEMGGLKSDSVQAPSFDVTETLTHVSIPKITASESQNNTMESTLHDKTISAMEKKIEALDLHVLEHTRDRTQSSGYTGLPEHESTSMAEIKSENTFSVQNATYVVDSQVTADQTRSSDGHVATVKTEFETEAPTSNTHLSGQTSDLKRSSVQNSTSSLKGSPILGSAKNTGVNAIKIETSEVVSGNKNAFGRDQSGDFNTAVSSNIKIESERTSIATGISHLVEDLDCPTRDSVIKQNNQQNNQVEIKCENIEEAGGGRNSFVESVFTAQSPTQIATQMEYEVNEQPEPADVEMTSVSMDTIEEADDGLKTALEMESDEVVTTANLLEKTIRMGGGNSDVNTLRVSLCVARSSSSALHCSMRQMLWAIYEKGIDFDTIVHAGGKEYKVSRAILISQSEVFKHELLSDSNQAAVKTVEIKDITEQAADAFVRFLYLGVVERDGLTEELLVLADHYKIKNLQDRCNDHLVAELNEDNASRYLVLAISRNDACLEARILTYIKTLSPVAHRKVFESKPWLDYINSLSL